MQTLKIKTLLQKINKIFYNNFSKQDSKNLTFLLSSYAKILSEKELLDRNLLDIYGSIISFWKFIYKKNDALSISIYNPTFKNNGWNSKHTVIQIASFDSCFIVDTLIMLFSSLNLEIHTMIDIRAVNTKRNKDNEIIQLKNGGTDSQECFIIFEIDRQNNKLQKLEQIEKKIINAYEEMSLVINDFGKMKKKLEDTTNEVRLPEKLKGKYYQESVAFLEFLQKNHFIFLGYCEFKTERKSGHAEDIEHTRCSNTLGLLSLDKYISSNDYIYPASLNGSNPLNVLFTVLKSEHISPIQRPVQMDIFSISLYNSANHLIGYRSFLGLYNAPLNTYYFLPQETPFLRVKKELILQLSGLKKNDHTYKEFSNIIDTYPHEELLLSSHDDLFKILMSIY